MPIPAKCECGYEYTALVSQAGQTVSCPDCGRSILVPTLAQSPDEERVPAAPPDPDAVAVPERASSPTGPLPDGQTGHGAEENSRDDTGADRREPTAPSTCPGCGAPLDVTAVLCIRCGYNRKTGRRTLSAGESAALARAEEELDREEAQERERSEAGLPWQAYAAALAALLFFCVLLPCLPPLPLILLGLLLISAGSAFLVAAVLEALLGVAQFPWLRNLQHAAMATYGRLRGDSESDRSDDDPAPVGTGKVVLLGILLGLLGLCMGCCGFRGCADDAGSSNVPRAGATAVERDIGS